jgi:hypothetical protein
MRLVITLTFVMSVLRFVRVKPMSRFHALISPAFCAASSWMRRCGWNRDL